MVKQVIKVYYLIVLVLSFLIVVMIIIVVNNVCLKSSVPDMQNIRAQSLLVNYDKLWPRSVNM